MLMQYLGTSIYELVTAVKLDRRSVALVEIDTFLKFIFIDKRYELLKDLYPVFMACNEQLNACSQNYDFESKTF